MNARSFLHAFLAIGCFVFLTESSFAQDNVWNIFGEQGRIFKLDFTQPTPTPVQVFQYGTMTNEEVIEQFEDENDKIRLTFFTDGQDSTAGFVYDSTFAVMPNGSDLISHYSIGEEAICRWPCSKDSIILFHQMRYDNPPHRASYYSVIDLSLPGNGTIASPLGDVVSKNHLLESNDCEGWTISHENIDKSRWMYKCRLIGTSTDSFEVVRYEISSSGVSAAVVLDTLVFAADINVYLEAELSPDNSKLAICNHQDASSTYPDVIVYDHDLCSGTLSNKQTYSCLDKEVLYLEFSPDNSQLYWISNRGSNDGHLGRIDIATGTNVVIDSTLGPFGKKIEAAGNGHLYIVQRNDPSIGEISNPNATDVDSIQYSENSIVASNWLWHGLPNVIDGEDDPEALIKFTSIEDTLCGGFQFVPDLCKPVTFFWNFGDGTTSADNSPNHIYEAQGTYFVSLNVVTCNDTLTHSDSVVVQAVSNPVSVTPSSVVCRGDSFSLSAIGGVQYAWEPADYLSDTSSANPIAVPLSSITYTVTVTDSGGCIHQLSTTLTVDTTCVWPGDADHNGVVDNNDFLAIGVSYGSTGTSRVDQTINWSGKTSSDWGTTLPIGADYKNCDADGNGSISSADSIAVFQNYSLTHAKSGHLNLTASGPSVYCIFPSDTVKAGDLVDVQVMLGTDVLPATAVYGLAFSVAYDANIVDETSARFEAVTGWMGTPGIDVMSLGKNLPTESRIDAAIVKTDHSNIDGYGQIGVLHMKIRDDVTLDEPLVLTPSGISMIDYGMNDIPANGDSSSVNVLPSGINGIESSTFSIYPNPANDRITIESGHSNGYQLSLYSLCGQELMNKKETQTLTILDVSTLHPGIYIVKLESGNMLQYTKVTITR